MTNLPELNQRYQLQKEIGQGGFGITYQALDSQTSQLCAIKELSFQRAEDWKSLELFEREAKVLANLEHPQIPKFIDFVTKESESEQKLYLIQEYIEGQSLKELVESGKHFTQDEILNYTIQVTQILVYLQTLSPPIIHRDIKPGNLIINPEGEVYLIDFGAVRDTVVNRIGGGSTVVGTFGYMPPEQFDGKALPATDIYSLGTTMIYALSQKEPHQIEKKALKLNFRPLVNISAQFAQILEKMIEPDWQERYQNASDLLVDLIKLKSGVFKPEREPVVGSNTHTKTLTIVMFLATAIAGLFMAGTFAFTWVSEGPDNNEISIREENPFLPKKIPLKKPEKLIPPSPPIPPPKPEVISEPIKPETMEVVEPINPNEAVKIKLLYRGQPIKSFTTVEPHFWFRNEDTNQVQKARTQAVDDHYLIGDLPQGKFGMQVYINANSENPNMYPGDYRVWKTFKITERGYPSLEIDLLEIIHLTEPQDNYEQMTGWGQVCDNQIDQERPVNIAWKPLGNNATYGYTLLLYECPYKYIKRVKKSFTRKNELSLDLPANEADQFYVLKLEALDDEQRIGSLITHGHNGMGWDYRFRIIE